MMDSEIQDIVDSLRSDGWLVIIKAMPQGHSFRIPGATSEYDAPHEPKDVLEGKTVVEAHDMKYRYSSTDKYRGDRTGVGSNVLEALQSLQKHIAMRP